MASSFIVMQYFSLLLCLLMIQVSLGRSYAGTLIHSSEQAESSPSSGSAPKVPLDLYYESLCPGCSEFIVEELSEIFNNGLIDIVDLKLVPWGNAKLYSNASFVCQHGPEECFLNTIEACSINAWPTQSEHFPLIKCIESLAGDDKIDQWATCFKKFGKDAKPIQHCWSSGLGDKLELKYAAETEALKPPKEFVPWVVVNGKPLKDDAPNFTKYVCKAYKGTPPKACRGKSPARVVIRGEGAQVHPVCYAVKA